MKKIENARRGIGRGASLAIAVGVSVLTACGGGGDSSKELQVRVAAAGDQAWTVCLDENANLACDTGEKAQVTNASGAIALTVDRGLSLAGLHWVAEQPSTFAVANADGTTTTQTVTVRMAAPADAAVVSALSTLVVAQSLDSASTGTDTAPSRVTAALGLDSLQALQAVESSSGMTGIARATLTALTAGTQAESARVRTASSVRATSASITTLRTVAAAAMDVIGRYTDTGNNRMLPTVTDRTLTQEMQVAINPTQQCRIEKPLAVSIDTEGGAPIVSKEDYLNARVRTEASAAYGDALDVTAQIRGRGNSTWGMPKKPYKLKLDKALALLGMDKEKDWALLANYSDKSLLRNAVAFCLGKTAGMDFTPAYRYIELTLNGQYQGVYQITDHMETGTDRVDIGDQVATDTDPGGFFVEIDARLDSDFWFRGGLTNTPYAFKSDTTAAQVPLVKQVIDRFETALWAEDFAAHKAGGYASQADIEALVDFYLINELMRNNDAFFSSTFVHRKNSGPLVFGPLWDFDIAAGNVNYNGNDAPQGWWVRRTTPYLERLFTDPVFAQHVTARWRFLSRQMPALQQFITDSAATLDEAQARNFQTWDILGTYVWPNAVVTGSYAGEIDYLSGWLTQRSTWMDEQIGASTSQ